jgi:hypothetical protein
MAIERRGIQFTLSAENRARGAFDEVKRQMSDVSNASMALRNSLAAFGVGLSLAGLVSFVKSGVDAAAQLDDLSEITGASVEELSKLNQVARISGTEFGIVESFLVKLNKALHTNSEEGKNARAALDSIGLSAEALRKLDPAEAMRRIAEELSTFKDDGTKSAAVLALTGRSAAQALPFLKDLATETGITARVTAEQAAEAEELQKQLRRLGNEATEAGQAMARDMLPALSNIIAAMREAYKEGGLLKAGFVGLGGLAANIVGDTETQKSLARLKQIEEQLAVARRQLATGTLNPPGASDSFFSFLIPDTKLSEEALAKVRATVDALEQERARIVARPPVRAQEDKPSTGFSTPETPGPADKRFENAISQLQQEAIKVQELTRFEEVLADVEAGRYGKLTADQRQVLTNLAAQVDLSKIDAQTQREVNAAIEASNKASAARDKAESERLERLADKYEDLIDPLKRYKDQLLEIDELERKGFDPEKVRTARGRVNLDMVEAQRRLDDLKKETQDTFDDMTEFSKQAARNIQDNFAENLFDLMQGEFDNLGSRFKAMLDRMVADALAARLAEAVFGKDFGKSGNLGGLLGNVVGSVFGVGSSTGFDTGSNPREFDPLNTGFSLKSLLNLFPKFDVGTPYVPHDMYAKIHQGERILTAAENRSGAWGGASIVFNITTPDVRGFRESQGQIAAALMSTLGARARRYT